MLLAWRRLLGRIFATSSHAGVSFVHPSDYSELLVLVHQNRTIVLNKSTRILKSYPLCHHHCLHRDGNSGFPPRRSRVLSPASRRSSLTSSRFFATNNRLGDGLLDLRELCLPLSDDLDSRNFSLREVRCSHQPISSDFLIEINCCIFLQSNSEYFFTEYIILDAFRLSLSHVKVVIKRLLSKLFKKFSIAIVLKASDDFPHCELRHILCTELCFHNDLRLPMQSSSIRPWSHSYAIILFVLSSQSFT